jgi:hypothetical protein
MTAESAEKVGRCWECGYSLRGLSTHRCPECGRGFNPADETTMNMGTELGAVRKWLMRPPGWPLHLLTAAAVIMSLWACAVPMHSGAMADLLANVLLKISSDFSSRFEDIVRMTQNPGSAEGRFVIATGLWILVAIVWMARRIARAITVKNLSKHKAATFACWRRWLATPLILGATVLICLTSLPVILGFHLSKSSFEQAVKDARVGRTRSVNENVRLYPRVRGIYPPTSMPTFPWARVLPGETWIFLSYNGAFVYRDDDQPPPTTVVDVYSFQGTIKRRVVRLADHWYAVDADR